MGVGGLHIQARSRRSRRRALLDFLGMFARGVAMIIVALAMLLIPGALGGLVFGYLPALIWQIDTVTQLVLALVGGLIFSGAALIVYEGLCWDA